MSVQDMGMKITRLLVSLFQVLYWYVEALYRQFVPPAMKPIDGEVILVTGAASGIGKEISRYIVQCGTNIKLVMWDLNITELEKLTVELKSIGNSGLQIFPYEVDISSRENIDTCCKQVKDKVGSVTIIFNNAGIAPSANFLHLTNEQIEKTFQVNLMSHLWIIRQFLPEMVSLNHGRIVNICSMGGLKAATHALPYFSAKFAVNGYTEALKAELALFQHDGVHCSTVYPYFVQTPLIRSLTLEKSTSGRLPSAFQRFLEPADVARKTVDGMRREYEYIYLPSVIPFILLSDYFMPLKFRRAMQNSYLDSFAFKDAEEQKSFNTPLLAPVKIANGMDKKGK